MDSPSHLVIDPAWQSNVQLPQPDDAALERVNSAIDF